MVFDNIDNHNSFAMLDIIEQQRKRREEEQRRMFDIMQLKTDPLPTYKLPEIKPLIGRWCSRQKRWCSEPICRRIYDLPPKHAHNHLAGYHKNWNRI